MLTKAQLTLIPVLLVAFSPLGAQTGEEITGIDFETIPTRLAAVSEEDITLAGPTVVQGPLAVTDEVGSSTGFRFPDGTLQTSAAGKAPLALETLTANDGLYRNRIVSMVPPRPYTEVCIVEGGVSFDIQAGGESTVGGNCQPGDVGWIIERDQRDIGHTFEVPWTEARLDCLKDGMRLPEPFEWQLSCDHRDTWSLTGMTNEAEWASNRAVESSLSDAVGFSVAAFGKTKYGSGCNHAGIGFLGRVSEQGILRNVHRYRCVR